MEYEYSFNVTNVIEYLKYFEENKFKLISLTRQIITIYRNAGLIARITQDIKKDGNKTFTLDFKEDKLNNDDLIIRKESNKIIFDNVQNCENILLFLNYKKDNVLERKRYVYKKGKVLIEIDIYNKPKEAYVIAIEGDAKEVDIIYFSLENLNNKYKIFE